MEFNTNLTPTHRKTQRERETNKHKDPIYLMIIIIMMMIMMIIKVIVNCKFRFLCRFFYYHFISFHDYTMMIFSFYFFFIVDFWLRKIFQMWFVFFFKCRRQQINTLFFFSLSSSNIKHQLISSKMNRNFCVFFHFVEILNKIHIKDQKVKCPSSWWWSSWWYFWFRMIPESIFSVPSLIMMIITTTIKILTFRPNSILFDSKFIHKKEFHTKSNHWKLTIEKIFNSFIYSNLKHKNTNQNTHGRQQQQKKAKKLFVKKQNEMSKMKKKKFIWLVVNTLYLLCIQCVVRWLSFTGFLAIVVCMYPMVNLFESMFVCLCGWCISMVDIYRWFWW